MASAKTCLMVSNDIRKCQCKLSDYHSNVIVCYHANVSEADIRRQIAAYGFILEKHLWTSFYCNYSTGHACFLTCSYHIWLNFLGGNFGG